MPSNEQADVARAILRGLVQRYTHHGYQRAGVTLLSSLVPTVPESVVEQVTGYLDQIEAIFATGAGMGLLTPPMRIEIISVDLLERWRSEMECGTAYERAEMVQSARNELHALTAFGYALGLMLPRELEDNLAAIAGMLTLPGFNVDAFRFVQRANRSSWQLFRTLVNEPDGAIRSLNDLYLLIQEVPVTVPPRAVHPMPSLREFLPTRVSAPAADDGPRIRGLFVALCPCGEPDCTRRYEHSR